MTSLGHRSRTDSGTAAGSAGAAPAANGPRQLDFYEAMSDFQTMFPSLDPQLIECVLRDNNGVVHTTVDSLLRLSEGPAAAAAVPGESGSAASAHFKRRQADGGGKADSAAVASGSMAGVKPDDLPPSYEQALRASQQPSAGGSGSSGQSADRHHTHPPKHSRQGGSSNGGGSGRHGGIRHGLSSLQPQPPQAAAAPTHSLAAAGTTIGHHRSHSQPSATTFSSYSFRATATAAPDAAAVVAASAAGATASTSATTSASACGYRRWNPPLLGALPDDFLRISFVPATAAAATSSAVAVSSAASVASSASVAATAGSSGRQGGGRSGGGSGRSRSHHHKCSNCGRYHHHHRAGGGGGSGGGHRGGAGGGSVGRPRDPSDQLPETPHQPASHLVQPPVPPPSAQPPPQPPRQRPSGVNWQQQQQQQAQAISPSSSYHSNSSHPNQPQHSHSAVYNQILADERLAIALQNEEFLSLLRNDSDFMRTLQRDTSRRTRRLMLTQSSGHWPQPQPLHSRSFSQPAAPPSMQPPQPAFPPPPFLLPPPQPRPPMPMSSMVETGHLVPGSLVPTEGYGQDQSPVEPARPDVGCGSSAAAAGVGGSDELSSQLRHMGKLSGRRFAEMARKFFGMARHYRQRRQQHLLLHQPQLLTMSAQTESTLNLLENGDFDAEDDGEVNPAIGGGGVFCGRDVLEEEGAAMAAETQEVHEVDRV